MKVSEYFTGDFQLDSERLLYRVMTKDDVDDLYRYASDPSVSRYLTWEAHPSRAYTARYVARVRQAYREGRFFDFALILRENGRMIGTCGLTSVDEDNRSCEIGYVLSREYWGRGLATEALGTLLAFAFSELGFHRAEVRFMADNRASLHVAEKNGMVFEGYRREGLYAKGVFHTIGTASILKREYLARHPAVTSPCCRATTEKSCEGKRRPFRFLRKHDI
ncbi:MAG: GNAT family N-acetyltransferase [Clostridia bacterium]|nr:GNAT family N-acetyltransferase [Clostridia bacterium]